jgi:hypothetical protein
MALWLAALNVAVTVAMVVRMQRFVVECKAIDSTDRLREYQRFVAVQMWGTLFLMGTILLIPFAIVGNAMALGNEAPSSWGPVVLMVVPLLLRKRIRAVEERCRSLSTTPALEAAYDSVNRIWVDRALPRFPSLPSSEAASASTARMVCGLHGDGVLAGMCTRCGAYRCVQCDRERPVHSALCNDCNAHFSELRSRGIAGERASKIAAYLVLSVGIAEVCLGAMMMLDQTFSPGMRGVGAALLLLGLLAAVAGVMWSWFGELGRRLSLIASVMHAPVFPLGTAIGLYALVVALRYHHLTSGPYREAIRLTRADTFAYTLVGGLLGIAAVPLYAGNLSGLSVAIFMLVGR